MLILKILSNYFESFTIFLRNILNDRSYMLLMLLLIILFIILALVIYYSTIKDIISQKHVLNNEFINTNNKKNEILILYFYTEWCPYCKQSMPELNKFEEYINGENANANLFELIIYIIKTLFHKISTIENIEVSIENSINVSLTEQMVNINYWKYAFTCESERSYLINLGIIQAEKYLLKNSQTI